MDYQSYAAPASLAAFVKCYWTLEGTLSEKQHIVPDGCMEMIFHYGDLFRQYLADGSSILQPRAFVFGQVTSPLTIEPTGTTGIFAVRFHPGGFAAFASLPLQEMENTAVPLERLFGDDGLLLEQLVLNRSNVTERISILDSFLLARSGGAEATDQLVQSSVDALLKSNGQMNVDELSGQVRINRRMLERKFSSAIGLSPKQLTKIIRLQATLKMMERKQFTSLTSLAYENGYYDQAHFIRDFKAFTGMSPRLFYSDNLVLAALFAGSE